MRLAVALAGGLSITLPLAAGADGPAVRPSDAKAYKILDESRHFPRLDSGNATRLIGYPRPVHMRQPHDSALDEPEVRRPIVDATCDADLVVVARVASAAAFPHPNGRWLFTVHDLDVSHVARTKDPRLRDLTHVLYVHPSGQDVIAGRQITTTLERYPALIVGDELLFFLVRIGKKDPTYRASLESPPLVGRGGLLYEQATRPPSEGPSIDGTSAREALRIVRNAICRPAARRRDFEWDGHSTPPMTPPGVPP